MMIHDFKVIKTISINLAALLLLGSVAGCGASSVEVSPQNPEAQSKDAQSEMADIDYEVPLQLPSIYVDQVGFKKESDKAAVFMGEDLPEEFSIKDIETGEIVYTGNLQTSVKAGNEDGIYAQGRFSDFKEEGNYCIYAEGIGESYSFSIGNEVYSELFSKACRKYYINRCGSSLSEKFAGDSAHSACHTAAAHLQDKPSDSLEVAGGWHLDAKADRDMILGSRIVENLLIAYEMNKESFTDDIGIPESGNEIPDIIDEVKYEADWMLKMQDEESGGVFGAAITDGAEGTDVFSAPVLVTPISMDATINFAAVMARFSYLYQQYDPDYATSCLKAADRAWNYFLSSYEPLQSSAAFKAAAELYRATGNSTYLEVLKGWFLKDDFFDALSRDENLFIGSVTYLSTSQPVDMEQCAAIMKAIMKKAETIARASTEDVFMVTDRADNGFGKVLEDMRWLVIINHVIYNHEYTTIIENHVHYMLGMNPDAANFLMDNTERTYSDLGAAAVMDDPTLNAMLVLVLGGIS